MRRLLPILAAAVWACGEDPPPPPSEVRAVLGAPSSAQFKLETELLVGSPIQRVGLTQDNRPLVSSERGVFEVMAGEFVRRNYYRADGDPEAVGAIAVIHARADGGAWLGGAEGLFVLDGLFITKSPLELEGAPVHALQELATGTLSGLWIGTDRGLLRRQANSLVRLEIEGLSGPARALGVDRDGAFALALIDDALVLIEPDGAGGLRSDRPPFETGAVSAIAASNGAVWAATDKGLLRYRPSETPPWQQLALADSMESAQAVLDVGVDPVIGAAWARTASALIRVDGDVALSFPLPDLAGALTLDNLGDVWLAGGERLHRRGTGSGATHDVSFAVDVKPWITNHCSTCHRNQTQDFESYEVFKPLAESALTRVRTGDMPRCPGGLRCSTENRLGADDYAILEQWIRLGLKE